MAVTGTVMPSPYQTVFDTAGHVVPGALIWTYLAGTSTLQATYSEATLVYQNTNPIVADSAGRFIAFVPPGASYKFVYETAAVPPAHGQILETVDLVSSVPSTSSNVDITGIAANVLAPGDVVYLSDGAGGLMAGRWYKAYNALPYQSVSAGTIGIALGVAAVGAALSIRTQGIVTGLTLGAGSSYYVGNPPGTMVSPAPAPPAYTRLVGIADTTTSLVLSGVAPVTPPPAVINTASGNLGIWAPPIAGNTTIVWNGTSDTTIDGIAAPVYLPTGTTVRIINGSTSYVLYFRYQVAGAASAALTNIVASGPTPVAQGGSITYQADPLSGIWRLVQHEQGFAITPPFNAATYSAPTGAWTVAAGNVTAHQYTIQGKRLFLNVLVQGSTITGTPGQLYLATPYQFHRNVFLSAWALDTAGYQATIPQTTASQALIVIYKAGGTNFAASANATASVIVSGVDVL